MPKRYREHVSRIVCVDYLFIISIKYSGNRLNIWTYVLITCVKYNIQCTPRIAALYNKQTTTKKGWIYYYCYMYQAGNGFIWAALKKKTQNVHDKICIYMRNVVIICALKICSFKFKIFMGRSVLKRNEIKKMIIFKRKRIRWWAYIYYI